MFLYVFLSTLSYFCVSQAKGAAARVRESVCLLTPPSSMSKQQAEVQQF